MLVLVVVFLLTACGGKSPFLDPDESLQTEGATMSLDPDRVFWSKYLTRKYLNAARPGDEANRRADFVAGFTDSLRVVTEPATAGSTFKDKLVDYIASQSSDPEDRDFAEYFVTKLAPSPDRLKLPFTPEQRRVILLYANTIDIALKDWRDKQTE